MSEQKIQEMIKKVAKRKTEVAGLRGELTQITKQMQDENCEALEDIEREITIEERKIKKLSDQIEKDVAALEKDYNWG